MMKKYVQLLGIEKNIWLMFMLLGGFGTVWVWFGMPHDGIIEYFQLSVKMLSFFCIIACIAFFPYRHRLLYLPIILSFLFYLMYLLPRLSYLGYFGIPSDPIPYGNEFYTHLYLLLYPSIILLTCAAYRLGGGLPGNCFKIAISGVLLIFSGLLDLMWFVINPTEIPEIIPYAYHLQMFFGRPAYYWEAIVFAICHIPFIVGVQFLPFDKWFKRALPAVYKG